VPRTDENGRHLGALLNYLMDGRVTNQQVSEALGMSSSAYYRRVKQDDFPNADELHKLSDAFGLSFTDLQVRLGFVTREDLEGYIGSQRLSIVGAPRWKPTSASVIALADGPPPTLHAAHSR
jgi:transcriptional regulator with XRE-family HTH domain